MTEVKKKRKQKLVIMRGLPGSGKSTFADTLVVKKGYKRSNKDALRLMAYGEQFNQKHEGLIETLDLSVVDIMLREGHNVVIDECNGPEERIEMLVQLFGNMEYGNNLDMHVEFIRTPLEECIARDAGRLSPVGKEVIMGMWNHYFKKLYEETEFKEKKVKKK